MKVLLVGHGFSPIRGSEPGNTWNWAWHLAKRHDVHVLANPRFRNEVEDFLAANEHPKFRISWVAPSPSMKLEPDGRNARWQYLFWTKRVAEVAAEVHRADPMDVVHHVSWNTISVPPQLWRLDIPFVWGPIGGGQIAPPQFARYYGGMGLREGVRSLRVATLRWLPSLRECARKAAVLLAINHETRALLEAVGGRDVGMFLDCGLPEWMHERPVPARKPKAGVTFLWAGVFEPTKALPLALEALARLPDAMGANLLVAGDGPESAAWKRQCTALGLDNRVEFLGRVPHREMPDLFARADAFLFTSLRDSSGGVVLEAMARGLPVVCLDHQGMSAHFHPPAAIRVPVGRPAATVAGIQAAMEELGASPQLRGEMSAAAVSLAREHYWNDKADRMTEIYESALQTHPLNG